MRRVGCFVAHSSIEEGESAARELEKLVARVKAWLQEKRLPLWQEGETRFEARKGKHVIASIKRTSAGDDELWEITLDEPDGNRRFFSRVCIGSRGSTLHMFAEMRAGIEGYEISPTRFDVRTPRLLPQILAARQWFVGKTMVTPLPIVRRTEEAGRKLWDVIRHGDRNLPVVAVSRLEGESLSPSLAEDLARDLAGLALVYDLEEVASWGLTRIAGKEWSCFNGAIRLYWPPRVGGWNYRANPVWTRERLIELSGSSDGAANRIRAQLRRWLFELSTYAVDEPDELVNLRADSQRVAIERLRQDAAEQGDYKRVAEELFDRCASLEVSLDDERRRLEESRRQKEDLIAQNESLKQVWEYQRELPAADIAPDEETVPASVSEAVARAREQHADLLQFGEDVEGSVHTLVPEAGPPNKTLAYLDGLADMTRTRNTEGLGKDLIIWLRERGIIARANRRLF